MTDFEKVIDFKNMYKAYSVSKGGKGFKKSSAKFNIMALDGINSLIYQLETKTYTISDYHKFKVYEPKERDIQTTSFKDKVVQHSLCDNVILPKLQNILIYDNYAGQIGKGTGLAYSRLKEHLKQFYSQHGLDGYILKCDILKFFYSISHQQLKDIVEYHFSYDPDICQLCNLFINSTQGPGIPLGNQISQSFALMYLDGMDKLITGELGIVFYGRYMDDFYLIHHDKQYLEYCFDVINLFLSTLKLQLNSKTQIAPISQGINYLGFHFYLTEDGDVLMRLKNDKKRSAQKKYPRMAKLVAEGRLNIEKFNNSYSAWKSHALHGNCENLIQIMDNKINQILKDVKANDKQSNTNGPPYSRP